LFLDEIQACPRAIQSLRYFYELLPDLHVIGTGTLKSLRLFMNNYKIPLGVRFSMQPLSLHEGILSIPIFAINQTYRLLNDTFLKRGDS